MGSEHLGYVRVEGFAIYLHPGNCDSF